MEIETCRRCGNTIFWQNCPTGGWWIHEVHPDDGHDAIPVRSQLIKWKVL